MLKDHQTRISQKQEMSSDNPAIHIALVEPEVQGNIGAIARVMKNTSFFNLDIVGTSFLDDDAYSRAMEAKPILDSAQFFQSIEDLRKNFDLLIATSSVPSVNLKDYRRLPIEPEKFWKEHYNPSMSTCIVLGRDGDGLRNSELSLCDFFITIPGNPEYPVYNISHAAAIIMYQSLNLSHEAFPQKARASGKELSILVGRFMEILEKVNFSKHKRPATEVMLRKLFVRSGLQKSEFVRIMGMLRKIDLGTAALKDETKRKRGEENEVHNSKKPY